MHISSIHLHPYFKCTVEFLNADILGTILKCPDYQGLELSNLGLEIV